jgi:hypothetical protein
MTMKTYLIAALLIAAAVTPAVAQTKKTFTAPVTQPKQTHRPPPPLYKRSVDGVIPRAFRGGNPLQMLNPRAPARYGTSQDAVCFDPEPMNQRVAHNGQTEAGKWKGIKFFVFNF